jgi:molybdopterin converting factor small subunit
VSIKVHIHRTHRQFTNGLDIIEVEGNTVGDCLKNLVSQFPNVEKEVFNKKGKLRNIIEIYVNLESAYPNELTKPVKDGDDIHVTLMLAGG